MGSFLSLGVALRGARSMLPGARTPGRALDAVLLCPSELHDAPVRAGTALPFATASASRSSVGYGLGALAVGLAVAAIGLWFLPGFVRDGAVRVAGPPVELVRNAHTGIVGDYLLWIVAGTALIGGIWAFTPP